MRFTRFPTVLAMLAPALVMVMGASGPAAGQAVDDDLIPRLDNASHIVMPQTGSWAVRHPRPRREAGVEVERVEAHVRIRGRAAATTLDVHLRNTGDRPAEAVLLLPVPAEAAVSAFMFEGAASEPTARLLPRDEARRLYDDIVRKLRDPALLEFAGYNLVRSSVFPVEPRGTQRVRLTYETILGGDENRIDYVLPRSESLEAITPWDVTVDIESTDPISMVYSPSHDLVEKRDDANRLRIRVAESSRTDPGAFRLSYLVERDGVSASIFAYPDPKVGGGYFLLLAGVPAPGNDDNPAIRREVTLVLDRSGSMAGGKLDQVQDAALQIIEGLQDGEAFNIIDYSNQVESFSRQPVRKNDAAVQKAREYLRSLRPNGGTNIHDALLEALRQEPVEGTLPIVLFLTDGLPTVGQTAELAIRRTVETGNEYNRRVFTFGVGTDVNVPLLDRLAEVTRAASTYVLPNEDVEVKVARTFRRLSGPVLANVELDAIDHEINLVRELMPSTIPDVFAGDQIIILGQYRESEPVRFRLSGEAHGRERIFEFDFDFDRATTDHAFVPRLWAARRIAFLVDEIRQAGALTSAAPMAANETILNDPRYRELIDEIVRLSTEFGVLSEYTAFLATEGTNLGEWNSLVEACGRELDRKAVRTRSGLGAVNQGLNVQAQKAQGKLNYGNRYWNARMERVAIDTVQQVNDCAFFKRGVNWIDSRLVARQAEQIEADRVVEFGSDEHLAIVNDLASRNRQGCLARPGTCMLEYAGEVLLIRNEPAGETPPSHQ